MNTRTVLIAGLLATAVIAFSGVISETTGVEVTSSVSAECWNSPLEPGCQPSPGCTVAKVVGAVTGKDPNCTM